MFENSILQGPRRADHTGSCLYILGREPGLSFVGVRSPDLLYTREGATLGGPVDYARSLYRSTSSVVSCKTRYKGPEPPKSLSRGPRHPSPTVRGYLWTEPRHGTLTTVEDVHLFPFESSYPLPRPHPPPTFAPRHTCGSFRRSDPTPDTPVGPSVSVTLRSAHLWVLPPSRPHARSPLGRPRARGSGGVALLAPGPRREGSSRPVFGPLLLYRICGPREAPEEDFPSVSRGNKRGVSGLNPELEAPTLIPKRPFHDPVRVSPAGTLSKGRVLRLSVSAERGGVSRVPDPGTRLCIPSLYEIALTTSVPCVPKGTLL